MLEITQQTLEKVAPLLDASDTESAGKLLLPLDRTSLCALLIHILREGGTAIAEAVALAYLRETGDDAQHARVAWRRQHT